MNASVFCIPYVCRYHPIKEKLMSHTRPATYSSDGLLTCSLQACWQKNKKKQKQEETTYKIHRVCSEFFFINLTRTSSDAFSFHALSESFILVDKRFPVDGNRIASGCWHCAVVWNFNFEMASLNCVCNRFVSYCWRFLHAFVYNVSVNAKRQKCSPRIWFRCGHDRFVARKNFSTDTFCWIMDDNFGRLPVKYAVNEINPMYIFQMEREK